MADGEMLPFVASAVNKSRLLLRNSSREEAIAFLEQWQSGQRISSAVVYEMARLAGTREVDSGRYRDLITEAIQDDVPETLDSALWLASQCRARGDSGRQLYFLMNALRIAPQSARVLYQLGEYYEECHDLDNAARFYLRAFCIERDLTRLYSLVNVLCMLDRASEAARICQEMYLEEKNSEVADHWAKCLIAMGAHDEAVHVLREHVKSESEERGFTLMELGRILCHVGRFEEAAKTYQEVLESESSPYVRKYAMSGLAYIALAQGNESEAASMLNKVLLNLNS
ncbi:tetratricopeptide repeat protein [Streptomyces sp. NPDC048242]|uniref:tetratricopeptide repeat protein n=1 Tax=Streptomyces sp. NPDC048242 TaxID=3155026 RepID=UPI00342609AA